MRVVIIGGSGHVGTYLVPRLVAAEHEVINISRARREPYQPHRAWQAVQHIVADRDAEEAQGVFGPRVRDLEPDVVAFDKAMIGKASPIGLAQNLAGFLDIVEAFYFLGAVEAQVRAKVKALTDRFPIYG